MLTAAELDHELDSHRYVLCCAAYTDLALSPASQGEEGGPPPISVSCEGVTECIFLHWRRRVCRSWMVVRSVTRSSSSAATHARSDDSTRRLSAASAWVRGEGEGEW